MKDQDKPQYPSSEEFAELPVPDKVNLFTSLPIPAQKLLIGTSSFATTVNPDMARVVSGDDPEEFEVAKTALLDTPYFSLTDTGRLQVADPMKEFINTDLRRVWEEQKQAAQEQELSSADSDENSGDELIPPTQEDYRRAYNEQVVMQEHDKRFDELLANVPAEKPEVREAIRGLWYHKPDHLLNPEKLDKIKESNPDLYKEVSGYYLQYLQGKLKI